MNLLTETLNWLVDPVHWQGSGSIPIRLFEHTALSGISLLIAVVIALPLAIVAGHTRRGGALMVNIANIGRAVPSLAIIGLVVPITAAIDPQLGFKVYPLLIGMVVLATPPLLVNTYVGITSVDAELVEAARGTGMREAQVLTMVELPLAVPAISVGVRSAAVQIVATATLGAIFGSGGLGRFLVEGIAQNNDGMIFGGVVLVAALALLTELTFAVVLRLFESPGRRRTIPDTGLSPDPV